MSRPGKEPNCWSHGFTFLELAITLVIIAAAVTISIPAFSRWLPNYRLRGAAQDLASNMQLAKMTAISKGTLYTVCFNQPVGSVQYDYVVFEDADSDLEYDPGEQIILKRRWTEDGYTGVSWDTTKGGGDGISFTGNDEGRPAVAFRSNGIPISNSGGMGMGSAYLTGHKQKRLRVVLSAAGNVAIREY